LVERNDGEGRSSCAQVQRSPRLATDQKVMNPNILIVDDDTDARTTLARVLEKEGYSVTGAASAEEALNRFDHSPFDLVLTDMRMEGMGGIELLRALKTRRSDVPVIIMTAFASIDTAVQAID